MKQNARKEVEQCNLKVEQFTLEIDQIQPIVLVCVKALLHTQSIND